MAANRPEPGQPPTWTQEGPDPVPVTAGEVLAWVAFLVLVTASRVGVAPDTLFEWDSANYALAMDEFDIYEHQPHPPGNPGFVVMLRLLAWTGDGTTPFLVANSLLGGATLLLLGAALRRSFGPYVALGTAALFAVSPQFWQQGAVSTAYVAECLTSMGSMSVALLVARRQLRPDVGAVLFSLLLSLRPSAGPALLPVVLVCLLLARAPISQWIGSAVAFGVTSLGWVALMLVTGGGWTRWRIASDALVEWQLIAGSGLAGDGHAVWERASRLSLYVLDGANLLLLVAPLAILLRARPPALTTAIVWVAWIAPGVAVYVGHHLAKSAYVLTLMPAVFLLLGACIASTTRDAEGRWRPFAGGLQVMVAALYFAWNVLAFYVSVPSDAIPTLKGGLAISGDYGAAALDWRTAPWKRGNELVASLDPETELPVWLFGSFESHRIATDTFRDRPMLAVSIDHRAYLRTPHTRPGELTFGDFQGILLREAPGGDTSTEPTRIDVIEPSTLRFLRHGRFVDVPFERLPERIVVFGPCPPCTIVAGDGLEWVGTTPLAWDLNVVELTVEPQ